MNHCTCESYDGDDEHCRQHTGLLYAMNRLGKLLGKEPYLPQELRAATDADRRNDEERENAE